MGANLGDRLGLDYDNIRLKHKTVGCMHPGISTYNDVAYYSARFRGG